jgi:hypothetical protein
MPIWVSLSNTYTILTGIPFALPILPQLPDCVSVAELIGQSSQKIQNNSATY